MALPKELTTVTVLSKMSALILFITLPIISFIYGVYYTKTLSEVVVQSEVKKNTLPLKENSLTTDKENQVAVIKQFMKQAEDYKKNSSSIDFKCYKKNNVINNEKIEIINKQLNREKRIMSQLCINQTGNKFILESEIPKSLTVGDLNFERLPEVQYYDFYEGMRYSSDYLLTEKESNNESFKLVDWLTNGEIIYSLLSFPYKRVKTYVYNPEGNVYFEPKLIEYCTYNVSGGYAARNFSSCSKFSKNNISTYLKREDLP